MPKARKLILERISTLLLSVGDIMTFNIGSIILWNEPKIPSNLRKKD